MALDVIGQSHRRRLVAHIRIVINEGLRLPKNEDLLNQIYLKVFQLLLHYSRILLVRLDQLDWLNLRFLIENLVSPYF